MQSLSPMADCSVNDKLVKVVAFLNQSFFQMINVRDPVTATAGLAAHPVYAAQPLKSVGVYVEKKCHSTVQNS